MSPMAVARTSPNSRLRVKIEVHPNGVSIVHRVDAAELGTREKIGGAKK